MGVAETMSLAGRIVVLQGVIGSCCIIGFAAVDPEECLAAFAAMVTTVVPSAYYVWVQQRTFNATRLLLHGVYKIVATMGLIAVSFAVLEVPPLGFFVSFAIMQLSYVAGLKMRA